ncbi:lysophospholipid acyltransferase family protein [Falsarthrobacter nasiphocae]|uniref:1-acyl-sn-glycerol-3-phosphate acyltransferase n=1 Tax=Falsarthrobacter nasiphocae TaxID=189863 RepID=A0AAE3YG87_9MICC|nr:lysophospholipid acyltransferase family protein [Falsarthrobacter nasiphocae]MDR6891373.1 1-acyl-sn-glycerol-3-phosphate acyltransferase [Falsarthrobacter nasiphocae]
MSRVPYGEREPREGAWPWVSRVGAVINKGVYRTETPGVANIPTSGGVIVAANHAGLLDGPALYAALPREAHILVKKEMFELPVVGPFLHYSGQIGIDRSGDRRALTAALKLLRAGKIVGILPEGTRGTGSVAAISSGVAWLASMSGAPVVPAAILGTRAQGAGKNWLPAPRSRVVVSFGEPFRLEARSGEAGRETMRRGAEDIRRALAEHVHAEERRTGLRLPSA